MSAVAIYGVENSAIATSLWCANVRVNLNEAIVY